MFISERASRKASSLLYLEKRIAYTRAFSIAFSIGSCYTEYTKRKGGIENGSRNAGYVSTGN